MTRPKIRGDTINTGTRLRDVHGIGMKSLTVLQQLGYPVGWHTTIEQFRQMTSSLDQLEAKIRNSDIDYRYTMPRFRMLWGQGGGPKPYTQNPLSASNMSVGNSLAERQNMNRSIMGQNSPEQPDTSINPGEVTNENETPEVKAMDRPVETDPALAKGEIEPRRDPTVLPDQVIDVSPPDREVAKPVELFSNEPVPLVPAAALGGAGAPAGIASARAVLPESHAERLSGYVKDENLPNVKANGEKDIGGDGFGLMAEEANVKPDKSGPSFAPSVQRSSGKVGRFSTTTLDIDDILKKVGDDDDDDVTVDVDINGVERPESRSIRQKVTNPTRNPYEQTTLFVNADKAKVDSHLLAKARCRHKMTNKAKKQWQRMKDYSFYAYNAPSQGVRMPEMPLQSSNYLINDSFTTLYQRGVHPLQYTFSPSNWTGEKILGPFQ
jgi:hypothetical protein